ncbi:MAG TPA: tetratricopeptide repeat protein [Steroidobacteraceae bacterium]|nr:tetratricopeptide repeat protein [Steroidobacteraceae bacterium]
MRSGVFLGLLATLVATAAVRADEVNSATVIGPNTLLTQGTEAMVFEHWQQGVELLEAGIKYATDPDQRAAAYSNLCAGYIALGDYDRALINCDAALKINSNNWRTYNNRAGALLGKGRLDEALNDVASGLALNPEGAILLKMDSLVRTRLKSLYAPRRPARDVPVGQF